MLHLQIHYHFKLDFQELNQYTWGKWLIYGTKHRKLNENKILSYCEALRFKNIIKDNKDMFAIMSHLQIHYHFKLQF